MNDPQQSASQPPQERLYVASRANVPERPAMWRKLRDEGWLIISTWIDEAGEGETADLSELWERIEREIRSCSGVILYAEKDDFPLKGAYVECGMAIALGRPVAVVTTFIEEHPVGSWIKHPLVSWHRSVESAREYLRGLTASQPPQGEPTSCVQSQPSWDSDPAVQIGSLSFDAPSKPPQGEPQPRERLAGDDPPGWYEIELPAVTFVRWWNGECWHYEPGNPAAIQYEDARNITGPLTYSPDLTRQLAESRQEVERLERELQAAVDHHERWTDNLIKVLPDYQRYSGDLMHNMLAAIDALKQQLAEKTQGMERLQGRSNNVWGILLCAPQDGECKAIDSLESLARHVIDRLTAAQSALKAAEERASKAEDSFNAIVAKGTCGWYDDQYDKIVKIEQQRDQLQAEVEKLRSQVVRGPETLGELIIGDNERLLPKGTYAYAKKDWQSWGCMVVDADGRTADRGWLYQPLPLPSSIRLPEKRKVYK